MKLENWMTCVSLPRYVDRHLFYHAARIFPDRVFVYCRPLSVSGVSQAVRCWRKTAASSYNVESLIIVVVIGEITRNSWTRYIRPIICPKCAL